MGSEMCIRDRSPLAKSSNTPPFGVGTETLVATGTAVPIMTANGLVVMAADGTYTYTPDPGFVGTESFDYEVCDASGNCVTATVSIAVTDPENPGNTAPFAIDDNFTTFSDPASPQTLSAYVLGNDSDPDGDVLEVSCLLYTSPSPRDRTRSRMPSSA